MDGANKTLAGADIFSEFVEVVIHNILYLRGVYPQGVFVRKTKYNIPVQVCLHPDVKQYISTVCLSLRTLLLQGAVTRVDVVLSPPPPDSTPHPLERFVLDLAEVPSDLGNSVENDEFLLRLEQSLRSVLLTLNVSDSRLRPLPKGCRWAVHVHTKESAMGDLEKSLVHKNFPWVEAEESEQQLKDGQIVPIKSLGSRLFQVQLYAEESTRKT